MSRSPRGYHQALGRAICITLGVLAIWWGVCRPAGAELAGQLYEALHGKLLPLPDDTLVYPAHGAGSMCGKHLSTETWSSMGVQRGYNYALQPMSKEAFISS